ncbi:MAG: hypothetical protein GX259_10575 [Bacteroidales bacterium]|nr:hypothetical protein [Bacteroidales bacterium]
MSIILGASIKNPIHINIVNKTYLKKDLSNKCLGMKKNGKAKILSMQIVLKSNFSPPKKTNKKV